MAIAAALAGCGNSQHPAADSTPDPTPTQSVTPTPTPTPAVTPTPTPTRTSKPTGGNGDSAGDHTPATAGGGICSSLSAAEVTAVIGGPLTGAALPGGGCGFTQPGPKGSQATFIETSFRKTSGGMSGAKDNATSSVEGDPEDLTGIGDAAFVVTGTSFGGPNVEGAGAVKVGDRLISVALNQSTGLAQPKVRALVVALLKLAAAQVG
ncbi:MAG: hypothetical protein JWQ74_1335 [Marmoricola sp.]|nr:hypothetical protein [Marmoricola sp.]